MSDETDFLAGLQGRIMALEFMMRDFVVGVVEKDSDPMHSLERFKTDCYQSLQHVEHPPGPYSDLCQGKMVEALNELFAQAEKQLHYLTSRGLL